MSQHGSTASRRLGKLNYFMAGSERMLKAHHKNAVFHKSLEDKKTAFDIDCHKKISKVQHDIYDVYFNEFVPLREEVNQIQQQLPNIHAFGNPRIKKLRTIPGNGKRVATKLPSIYSRAIAASDSSKEKSADKQNSSEDFLNQLRQLELERQTENGTDSGNVNKKKNDRSDGLCHETSSLLWQDSDSEDNFHIDEKRVEIIKTAIALTSQPPKPPTPRKTRRLRKSFLITLRRQSKVVWEEDLLKRIGAPDTKPTDRKSLSCDKTNAVKSTDDTNNGISGTKEMSPKWRPSLANNKIMNDSDESDDEQYLNKIIHRRRTTLTGNAEPDNRFPVRMSRVSIISDNDGLSSARGLSFHGDTPVHDMDDMYYTESSSPDIYSLASEGTGSYTTGSSYTRGSDSDEDYENGSEYRYSDEI